MKNFTLRADAKIVEAARDLARSEGTALNEKFRAWLTDYVQRRERVRRYDEVIVGLRAQIDTSGTKPKRDELQRR